MVTQLADLFPMILSGSVCALLLAPLTRRYARRLGLVDIPGSAPHKTHREPTAQTGGLVIILGLWLSYGIVRPQIDMSVVAILAGATWMMIWGALDDHKDLAPYWKIGGQLLAAGLLIVLGIQVHVTRLPWLDLAITVLWVVGMVNAFNLVDSKDGLAIGLAGVAASFFMLVTIDSGQPVLSTLSAGLLGACLGMFFFNTAPAYLFLGDSGAQVLGFVLASLGIAYVPAGAGLPQGVSWFTPILVLGVPIFDTTLVVVSRLRRHRPIYRADQDHTYHRLVGLGLDSNRSVLAMHLAAVMLGLMAFMALGASVLFANLIFLVIVVVGSLGIAFLEWHLDVRTTLSQPSPDDPGPIS
jgi:UDP-GlcNAc:undecaprenyl-phosphate GlcNAc-1-phosphate transferase